jgi:DNA excision repair protein ERCC-2
MQPRIIPDESATPSCTVSVRALVEHLLRSGDLRFDLFGTVSAAEGIRAHQQIQRNRPREYQSEVAVRMEVEHAGVRLCVTGRIDGVLVEQGRTIIEEIKTTRRSRSDLEQAPNPLHWGQAQCYACMWAVREKMPSVVVRLTYMNVDSGKIHQFDRPWETEALKAFFDDLALRYGAWVAGRVHWRRLRDRSISKLVFPFTAYRTGQREMAVAVYRNIRDKGHLLIQAATGIGKTLGALFPAVKALGDGLGDKVVFLTARGTGRLAAESALKALTAGGLRIKAVTLTAKDKICFNPSGVCGPDDCQWARGYYDRIHEALADALDHDDLTRERIERIADRHRVCPFEFSLELVTWSDCVICDYNYAFAPGVMLQRLFGEEGGRHHVLVDEAHNLVDRSREMFSASLAKRPFLALRRRLKGQQPGVHHALGRVNSWMAALRRRCMKAGGHLVEEELPVVLIDRLQVFLRTAEKWLALNVQTPFRDDLLELFFDALRFERVAEIFDGRYKAIYRASPKGLRIKLFCVDPSHQLQSAWKRCRSAVLFSATLTPGGYFQSILGCSEQATMLNLPSPFPSENLGVFVADQITTLYRRRQETCRTVTQTIADLVRQRPGHYMLFFPSYEYLQMVYALFRDECAELETVIQTPDMDDDARAAFLSNFKTAAGRTLVGFVVMGGIFGEAIDLRGERLIGAAIVGVGLPGICLERDLIRDYYHQTCACGFEFAYQYPGINRVLQAAGRVIRTEKDQGTLLLIDHRYGQRRYRRLLPAHWRLREVDHERGFQRQVRTFWECDELKTGCYSSEDPSGF